MVAPDCARAPGCFAKLAPAPGPLRAPDGVSAGAARTVGAELPVAGCPVRAGTVSGTPSLRCPPAAGSTPASRAGGRTAGFPGGPYAGPLSQKPGSEPVSLSHGRLRAALRPSAQVSLPVSLARPSRLKCPRPHPGALSQSLRSTCHGFPVCPPWPPLRLVLVRTATSCTGAGF